MDQSGKVSNPARGQLNRENEYFPVIFAPENLVSRDGFGSPVPRQSAHLHTQADLVLTYYGIPPEFRGGVHLFVLNRHTICHRVSPEFIGSCNWVRRWRSLSRARWHRASKPQGSSERVVPWQVTIDHSICTSLFSSTARTTRGILSNDLSYYSLEPGRTRYNIQTLPSSSKSGCSGSRYQDNAVRLRHVEPAHV